MTIQNAEPDQKRDESKHCRDGKLHREDGPAVIRADGTREWFQNGVPVHSTTTPLHPPRRRQKRREP